MSFMWQVLIRPEVTTLFAIRHYENSNINEDTLRLHPARSLITVLYGYPRSMLKTMAGVSKLYRNHIIFCEAMDFIIVSFMVA